MWSRNRACTRTGTVRERHGNRTSPCTHIRKQRKTKAAVVSLLAALGLTLLKLAVGLTTNSLGILSEALHSGLDLLAAAMTLLAVRIAAKPADQGHPYGHGKVENLSALGQTLLLFLTCVWVVHEGVTRLLAGASPVTPSLWGVGVMAVSMAVDINRVRILRRVARRYKSQALEADALHFSTDILSSAVVLAGRSGRLAGGGAAPARALAPDAGRRPTPWPRFWWRSLFSAPACTWPPRR